jgi:outer membrane protein OmpA-like peptidoglycan-associated protein
MKKNLFRILAVVIIGSASLSCSNPSKMAKEAQLISVDCNPKVLEVIADEITATYTLSFPEGYFHPKAILEIVPVLVYEGGEALAPAYKLQGTKVADNFKVISQQGEKASNTIKFAYKPGMEVSHLELRVSVWNNLKRIDFPAPYKIADGANTTYKLVSKGGVVAYASDQYRKVIPEKKETQIMYDINSAKVKTKELTKEEIKEFEKFLADVENDGRRAVKSTDIVAYASPDGSVALNTKLSDKRSETAKAAFDKITKKTPVAAPVNISTIAEDWEGFQELVAASTIADKDLILRVLSMYSDPAVREREIKNMSKVFKTLADKILPELRRARFIANVDYTNYSDEELTELAKTNIEIMDVEALLYAATLVKDIPLKEKIYTKAGEKFKCDRAYNNLTAVYLENGNITNAKIALSKVSAKNTDYYYNNAGLIALRENNLETAKEMFSKVKLPDVKRNIAIIDILEGRYNDAVNKLAGTGDENEGLAYILTNQLDKALKVIKCKCPHASYLRAIVAARKGNLTEVAKELAVVHEKSEELKLRSQKDIEFAKFRE